jgi:hypothetical protein
MGLGLFRLGEKDLDSFEVVPHSLDTPDFLLQGRNESRLAEDFGGQSRFLSAAWLADVDVRTFRPERARPAGLATPAA